MRDKDDLDANDEERVRSAMAAVYRSTWRKASGVTDPQSAPVPEPHFENLVAWVAGYFAPTFGRLQEGPVGHRWCAKWWDHPEAVLRLDALWTSWEIAMAAPGRDLSGWVRDHLNPNLAVLTAADGPFAACTSTKHTPTQPLPSDAPPAAWWPRREPWQPARPEGSDR